MVIIHGPIVMAMDIQIGTIIYGYNYGYPSWNNYYGYNYGYPSWNNYYGYNGWNYGYSLENDETTFIGMAIIIIG